MMMADDPRDDEDDVLELTDKIEGDEEPGDKPEGEYDEGGEEETVVTIEGEDPPAGEQDSSVIRRMRQELRDAKRELSEARRSAPETKIEVGDKPTMESCDFDESTFETELDKWKERKRAAEAHVEKSREGDRQAQEAWQADLTAYEGKKASLGVADFEESEDAVKATLSLVQQAVIVKAANDPAAVIYALGRSDAKLAELAKYTDPIKMAAAVARIEGAIKVTKRRAPNPDRPASGSGALPGNSDKQLEKLERDAERNGGDRSKIAAYKLSQRNKK